MALKYDKLKKKGEKSDDLTDRNIISKFEDTISENEIKLGKPVIGWMDLSAPVELIMAAGLNNMSIRGDIRTGDRSDQYIQTYSCAYIKNSI